MRMTAGRLVDHWRNNPDFVHNQYAWEDELHAMLGHDIDDDGFKFINKEKRLFNQKQLSILDVGEAFCGRETLRTLWDKPYGMRGGHANTSLPVGEEVGGGALGPSQFSTINAWLGTTDGLLGGELLERFTYAIQMAREIVKWDMDVRIQENKEIRYSMPTTPGEEDLQPAEEFPSGDMKGEFIRHARMAKMGRALSVAWEASHFDQTQSLMEAAGMLADRFGITIDERVLRAVFGIGNAANSYKYNDVNTNTYQTVGTYVNKITNQLTTEAASLDVAEQQLLLQTDPATGLEIDVRDERFLITTPFQRLTAHRLQNPISGSLQVGSLTDPDRYNASIYIDKLKVHWSQRLVRLLTTSRPTDGYTALTAAQAKYRWVYGDTRRAFKYRSAKDITTYRYTITEAPQLARRDLLMEIDVSEMGAVSVIEPRYCVLNIKDS